MTRKVNVTVALNRVQVAFRLRKGGREGETQTDKETGELYYEIIKNRL